VIAIVDYGMGNLKSVQNALEYLGGRAVVTRDHRVIAEASRLILPGVGTFGDAMDNLRRMGLVALLNHEVTVARKPVLGICLGMQLLARLGMEYGQHMGLSWIDAEVALLPVPTAGLKLPHVGWNDVDAIDHALFAGVPRNTATFYFTHSYAMRCVHPDDVIGWCDYGEPFAAAVCRGNVAGVQFHPEKSQDNGLQLLTNFLTWRP